MKVLKYDHWRDVPLDEWLARWPNFHPSEVCSPDDKSIMVRVELMDNLQAIRFEWNKPMHLTSVYRTKAHNDRVGGSKNSQHLLGRAADVALATKADGPKLEKIARKHGMTGIGRYGKRFFIHMDCRVGPPATWGSWK